MAHKALKIICLGIFVLMLGTPSLAQNTKGDKPTPTNSETRFKTPKKPLKKGKADAGSKAGPTDPADRLALLLARRTGGTSPGARSGRCSRNRTLPTSKSHGGVTSRVAGS